MAESIDYEVLKTSITQASTDVSNQMKTMTEGGKSPKIEDMFEMQILMTKLSQVSEMSTGVVSASNTAMMSMARGVKG